MGNEAKDKKVYFTLVIVFSLFMLFLTIFGDRGLWELNKLNNMHESIKKNIQSVKSENERLYAMIGRLKTDKHVIENIARKDFGMVKEGEIVFIFQD